MLRVHLGYRDYDDRDSMLNKRIDTPGILMANLFRVNFNKLIKDMKIQINKEFLNGSWKAMDTLRDKIILDDLWNKRKAPWKVWREEKGIKELTDLGLKKN